MESKKTKKYDVENKRDLHFWIGMSLSLLFVISAFEWKSEYDSEIQKNVAVVSYDEEIMQKLSKSHPNHQSLKLFLQ